MANEPFPPRFFSANLINIMHEEKETLIIFTRYPVAGEAKTRLIPALGKDGAADMQRKMTEATLCHARKTGAAIEVWYTGGTEKQMQTWLGDDLRYVDQGEGELSDRMESAFQTAFQRGIKRVVLIGGDCPSNRADNIMAAFEALKKSDVVLGPSTDGGYYLIGLRSYVLQLIMFEDIDWSSAHEINLTLSSAAGVRLTRLPTLCNIDTPEDIPPIISVVIPTLNAAETMGSMLGRVLDSFGIEVIVVDGGSEDDSMAYADAAGAKMIETSSGRAHQMNAGANASIGKILLFLYPNTLLPENWDVIIRKTLSDDVALGAFAFSLNERLPGIKLIEWGVRVRSTAFALPYGDQGFFMKRETFDKIGGFPDQPIMEDYELVRRMRKLGQIVTLDTPIVSSSDRWKKHGVWKTLFMNQLILFAYRFHIPQKWLGTFCKETPDHTRIDSTQVTQLN